MCRPLTILATTTDDQGHTLVCDAWNRLIGVSSSTGTVLQTYQYDGTDRRIEEATPGSNPTELYYSSSWQVLEEDSGATGAMLHAQNVWSPVFTNALILRDFDFLGWGVFEATERAYVTQDAQWNVTSQITHETLSGTTILPDANGDGSVDFTELLLISQNFGKTITGGDAVGDFNHDGVVDFADELKEAQHYGATSNTFVWAVNMRESYTAYGVATYYTGNFSVGVNFLGFNYGFQGGRVNSVTGTINFDYRDYNPRTYTWDSTDPIQSGMNWYESDADNPINSTDASGLIEVRTNSPTLNGMVAGAFNVTWDFELNNQAPDQGGYIIQLVNYSVYSGTKGQPEELKDHRVYLEAWYVEAKGTTLSAHPTWGAGDFGGEPAHYAQDNQGNLLLDDNGNTIPTHGHAIQYTSIRFFPTASLNALFHTNGPRPLGDLLTNPPTPPQNGTGFLMGGRGYQQWANGLPALDIGNGKPPAWWDSAYDKNEPPAGRAVMIKWNDCDNGATRPVLSLYPKPAADYQRTDPITDPSKIQWTVVGSNHG